MLRVQNQAEQLEKLYTLRDKERVMAFIEQNPGLFNLLLAAPDQIKPFFPDATLSLEVIQDVELASMVNLWIFIKTMYRGEEGLIRLEQLDETWWIEASAKITNIEILLD